MFVNMPVPEYLFLRPPPIEHTVLRIPLSIAATAPSVKIGYA